MSVGLMECKGIEKERNMNYVKSEEADKMS